MLRQAVRYGGLEIPDLKCYYEASNLTTIARLSDQRPTTDRMETELENCKILAGYELLWQTNKQHLPGYGAESVGKMETKTRTENLTSHDAHLSWVV